MGEAGMLGRALRPLGFVYRLLLRFIDDDGFALSGYLAFVALMSFLPFLVFVFTLLGIFGQAEQGRELVDLMFDAIPADVADTLRQPVGQVIAHANANLLTLSVVVVLWISGSGLEGLRTALNRAYRVRETRRYWRCRLQSTGLVLMFSGFMILAVVFLVVGPLLWLYSSPYIELPFDFRSDRFPNVLQYGVGGGSLFLVSAALYHFLPNNPPGWISVLPGAGLVCVMVIAATRIYSFYLEHFASYTQIYGSLGGVISTMLFFYALAVIFVVSGELNAMLAESRSDESGETS
jgi:membrane protein